MCNIQAFSCPTRLISWPPEFLHLSRCEWSPAESASHRSLSVNDARIESSTGTNRIFIGAPVSGTERGGLSRPLPS